MNNKPSASQRPKQSKVPASRLSRLSKLGGLATSIAAHTIGKTAGQLLQAKRPSLTSTVLTAGNASSLAKSLSEMRGAAMKVGQMLSMDAGEFLPAEWEPILATLRQGANAMPKSQLLNTLNAHWGHDWAKHFRYFSFEPIAAASIGQVHKAQLNSGQYLAVKIQYPGVAQSIDSDVNNIGRLLKFSSMLPSNFDINSILEQAKSQLKTEADYVQEARYIEQFAEHLSGKIQFVVPSVYHPLSNEHILCMSFIEGEPIEGLLNKSSSEKSRAMDSLFELMLNELFDFGLVQSDPNFANYLYLPQSKQIALLDFGACRPLPQALQKHYKNMAHAMRAQNITAMEQAMLGLELIQESMPKQVKTTILNGCLMASECLQTEHYNIKQTQLIQRLFDATKSLMQDRKVINPPNFDVALVNRKVSGMVMLANKMQCSLSLRKTLNIALPSEA
jgi:predicted unusual protein kinase regulating ubiquinone biosynthesis (AarF/ABC1/UbiB family)